MSFVILSKESRSGLNFMPPEGYSIRFCTNDFEIGVKLDEDPNDIESALWVKKDYDNPTTYSEVVTNKVWMPLYTKIVDSPQISPAEPSKEITQKEVESDDCDDDIDDDYKIKEVNKAKKMSYEEYDYGLPISRILAKPRNTKKPHQRDYQKDRRELKSRVADFVDIGQENIFCPHGTVHEEENCLICYPFDGNYDCYDYSDDSGYYDYDCYDSNCGCYDNWGDDYDDEYTYDTGDEYYSDTHE